MDVLMESSGEFIRPSSKPGYMPTLAASRETSEFMKNSNKTDNNPVVPPITTKSLDRGSLPTLDKGEDDDEDAGINFIPSFLDPGRNGRRRRQLDRPSTTGGMDTTSGGGGRNGGSKLDELDAILGFGGASAKSDIGAKTIVDPFANVEKRTFPKPPVILDSDSSDDDIFRSKPKKKDSFFGSKPSMTSDATTTAASKEPDSILPARTTTTTSTGGTSNTMSSSSSSSSGNNSSSQSGKSSQNAGAMPRSPTSSSLPALTTSGSRLSSPNAAAGAAAATAATAVTTPGSSSKRHRARFAVDEEESQDFSAAGHNKGKTAKDTLEESTDLEGSTGILRTRSDEGRRSVNKNLLPVSMQSEASMAPAPSPQGQGIQLTRRSVSAASRLSPAKPTVDEKVTNASAAVSSMGTAGGSSSVTTASTVSSKSRDAVVEDSLSSRPTSSGSASNATTGFTSSVSAAATTTKTTRFADDADSSSQELQKLHEKAQQQRQVNDRRMEEELQHMRAKLDQLSSSSSSSSVPLASHHLEGSREKQVLLEQNMTLQTAHIDSKRVIAALEMEISRLKDELNVQAAKHLDTMKHQQETYEQDLHTLKTHHRLEVEAMERRHGDSLAALKKVHAEEISSWKERYKGAEVFETITQQIRNTTGSMKFLEEQLQQRHRNVEMMREGQFEAREKMLIEMEEKARERAEAAEAEGYKLKGILQHMQQMVDTLRSQGMEDKQRLVQEHQRIKALQDSLEQDKKNFYQRCSEETQMLKVRSQDVEREVLQWNQEKVVQLESINTARRKVENERTELQAYLQAQKLNLENLESTVREEEKRLQRQREEFHQEKYAFEQRKLQASRDLEEADDMKRLLNNAAKKLHHELDAVAVQSHKLQMDQEELMQAQQELIRQREALELREQTLREGLLDMRQAATGLTTQELQVQSAMRQLEQRRKDLDSLDRDIATRRVSQAVAFRESLEFHQQQGHHNLNLSGFHQLLEYAAGSNVPPQSWANAFQQQLRNAYIGTAHRPAPSAFGERAGTVDFSVLPDRALPKEVRLAQRQLKETRLNLQRVSSRSLNTKLTLHNDEDFLKSLRSSVAK
eukprot:gene2245-1645_t